MSYKASMACAGAFAAAVAFAGSAFAAEPAPTPPPPVPVFTWTGLYVGGQIGYAWGRDPVTWFGTANDLDPAAGAITQSPQGVIGGAHVGYNLQYSQWAVFGVEGSVDGTSLSKTVVVPLIDLPGDTFGGARHHALADARWTRDAWAYLATLHPAAAYADFVAYLKKIGELNTKLAKEAFKRHSHVA